MLATLPPKSSEERITPRPLGTCDKASLHHANICQQDSASIGPLLRPSYNTPFPSDSYPAVIMSFINSSPKPTKTYTCAKYLGVLEPLPPAASPTPWLPAMPWPLARYGKMLGIDSDDHGCQAKSSVTRRLLWGASMHLASWTERSTAYGHHYGHHG